MHNHRNKLCLGYSGYLLSVGRPLCQHRNYFQYLLFLPSFDKPELSYSSLHLSKFCHIWNSHRHIQHHKPQSKFWQNLMRHRSRHQPQYNPHQSVCHVLCNVQMQNPNIIRICTNTSNSVEHNCTCLRMPCKLLSYCMNLWALSCWLRSPPHTPLRHYNCKDLWKYNLLKSKDICIDIYLEKHGIWRNATWNQALTCSFRTSSGLVAATFAYLSGLCMVQNW